MNLLSHSIRHPMIQIPILIIIFSFVYLVPISLIFRNDFSNHFSHGILIIAISAYMVWTKRDRLFQANIRPNLIMGSFVAVIGSITMTAGAFSGTPLLEGLSLLIGIFGMVWLLFGSSIISIVAIPISFLIFMFPIFDKLFRGYTDHLQLIAAFIGSTLLEIVGLPNFHQGKLIQLPHIALAVGEACSGINHMIALMTLGVFLGYVNETKWFNKLIFVVIGLIVGIIANGIRVALIGLWTRYSGTESFHGPFDIFYSSFVFFVGLVAIILVRFVLLKHNREKTPVNKNLNETHFKDQLGRKYFHLSFIVAIIILASTCTYQALARPLPFHLKKSLDEFALNFKNWEGKSVETLQEPYEIGNFDMKVRRIYHDQSGNQIKLFVGYLTIQEQGNNIEIYPHEIIQNDSSPVKIKLNSLDSLQINSGIYRNKDGLRQVYFWYDINGRVVRNRYGAKLATIIDAFLRGRTNAAIIILSTDIKRENQTRENEKFTMEFIRTILPLTQSYLSNAQENVVEGKI